MLAAGVFMAVFFGLAAKNAPESTAIKATDFQAGRIIDDGVFYNPNTMSVQEIQTHLDKYSASCDMWGTQAIGYGRKINGVAVNPNVTRREYARMMREAGRSDYHDAPYVCISKYYENPTTHKTNFDTNAVPEEGMISAAQIIYDAAHKYTINPQVLLVMLKKESYVWGDTWPLKNEYNTVMGYACPDNAPCDSAYFGFYNQVMKAAWQLNYYKEHIYSYGYYPYMTNNILYSPDRSCGSKSVYLENVATTSLYIYTPYTPNDAALANYPGTATCGSYGNRNFFMYFSEWFGSTFATTPQNQIDNYYNSSEELRKKLGEKKDTLKENTSTGIFWQEYENGFIVGSNKTGYYESMGKIREVWQAAGFEGGKYGFPTSKIYYSSETGAYWQNYQNAIIVGSDETGYFESSGEIRKVWQKNGFEGGILGFPISEIIEDKDNNLIYQKYQHGAIISEDGKNYFITKNEIMESLISNKELRTKLGKIKADIGSNASTGIIWQEFENGFMLGSEKTGFYESSGKTRDVWQKNGFEGGTLGFPTSAIVDDKDNGLIYQEYQNGVIISANNKNYYITKKAILDDWLKLKKARKDLGKINADFGSNASTGIIWQSYEKGLIVGSEKTGFFESSGEIRKVWQMSGFEGGTLGFPTGEITEDKAKNVIYQTYQNGIILSTDGKTYKTISGKIYTEWDKLKESIGFPTATAGSNAQTGITWQAFQNGLIVGSEKTGFFESRGIIRETWQKYGFEGGQLGFPTSDIIEDKENNISYQKYQGGTVVIDQSGKAFATKNEIFTKWLDAKKNGSDWGAITANFGENKATGIVWQSFEKNLIVGSAKTGYFESNGKTRIVWQYYGFESGKFGFPLSDIIVDKERGISYQKYQGGVIIDRGDGHAYMTISGILDAWLKNNTLGKFVDNYGENKTSGIIWQGFENGLIVGSAKTGFYESSGKIRETWQKNGFENGRLGFPTGNIVIDEATGVSSQKYQGGTIECSTTCTVK
jgi:uncharacterized protein with LGFP repeats